MGRGLARPDLRLGWTEEVSEEVETVGDVGDSERQAGERGGVLLAVGEASFV